MSKNQELQEEIDALREELRRLKHEHAAAIGELSAARGGKLEAAKIAEIAQVHAAECDALKAQNAELAAYAGDLASVVHYFEESVAPPAELMQRVNAKRYGRKLANGVPNPGAA